MTHKIYRFSKTEQLNLNYDKILDRFCKDITGHSRKRVLKKLLDEYKNRQMVASFIDIKEEQTR